MRTLIQLWPKKRTPLWRTQAPWGPAVALLAFSFISKHLAPRLRCSVWGSWRSEVWTLNRWTSIKPSACAWGRSLWSVQWKSATVQIWPISSSLCRKKSSNLVHSQVWCVSAVSEENQDTLTTSWASSDRLNPPAASTTVLSLYCSLQTHFYFICPGILKNT